KIKEVKNFEEQKKTLEQRKNIIEQLRKNQSLPVKILTEMSNVLPSGVWLQSMSVSGENINISGTGFTNEDVVNYVDNLKNSKLFADVNLIGTQKSGSGKVVTYQFTLTCRAKAS
ncbi:MAG: PilN domain-containing protein, partial [Thermodesulfovibrionales bacterium]